MHVLLTPQSDGKTRFSLTPEKASEVSPPVGGLLLDHAPDSISGDRLAVAMSLVFQRYLRGSVRFPKPVSFRTAYALADFKKPVRVSPGPIDEDGTQGSHSGTTIILDLENRGWRGCNSIESDQVTVLSQLRSDRWVGRLFAMDTLMVGSNAWMFDSAPESVRGYSAQLGVAVLLAADLAAHRIVVPHGRSPEPDWEGRVTALGACVGIEFRFCQGKDVAEYASIRGWNESGW